MWLKLREQVVKIINRKGKLEKKIIKIVEIK